MYQHIIESANVMSAIPPYSGGGYVRMVSSEWCQVATTDIKIVKGAWHFFVF